MGYRLLTVILLCSMQSAYAFILMGPIDPAENTLDLHDPAQALPAGPFTGVASANMTDDLGGPKHIKEFYRWNTPHLVYGFDREFVRFFGEEGILAVNDAMRVLNDFFQPEDGQYSGISELDLMRHGFGGNYSTYWLNVTAKNENLMDIKSLVLGMMVNYLGLGNPYRQMFTATNAWYADQLNAGSVVIGTTLKNFDPITLQPTDWVNGDQYAYRLIHDRVPGWLPDPNADNVSGVTLDMEEFTNSDSVNTYSAVSAIVDAFYGNTDMVWTRVPSRYGFGIYYDGLNAMGGSFKPRHALTYDDAGGLKYMYNTNTVVMEYIPYALVTPADFTKTLQQYNLAPYSDPLKNRIAGVFPTRNNQSVPGKVAQSHPLFTFMNPMGPGPDMVYNTPDDVPLLNSFMGNRDPANPQALGFVSAGGKVPGKMAWAFRGGIDSIQFHEVSYDSLLNMTHYATNYQWIDTFMTNASIQVPVTSTLTNTTPGAAVALTESLSEYYQQVLSRTATTPDFIFSADQALGFVGNQVQTAWIREAPADDLTPPQPDDGQTVGGGWKNAPVRRTSAFDYNRLYYTSTAGAAGPGIWSSQPGPWQGGAPIYTGYDGLHMVFNSSINIGGFEVVWSGDSSVVGNQILPIQYQQWAYIKGPGVSDFVKFPRDYDVGNRLIENTILPITGVPVITMVSDNGGLSSIAPTSLSRTEEAITMIGTGFLSATAIEILDPSGAVVQSLSPADPYVKHDKLIEIPSDTIGYKAEGVSRKIRVWNPVGPSELSKETFNINSGRPMIYSTSADGLLYNRGMPLTINGTGFKSKTIHARDGNSTITHIRVDDLSSGSIWPESGLPAYGNDVSTTLEVVSDKKAFLLRNVFPASIDTTAGVRVRVSRGSISSLSPPAEPFIAGVTGVPTIDVVRFMDDDTNVFIDVNETSPLRRDAALVIRGSGLNTVSSIEIVQMDGFPFDPPVYADLLNKGNIEPNGVQITLQKGAFTESSADGHSSFTARLRVVNPFGTAIYSRPFNVNIQPGPDPIGLEGPMPPPALSVVNGALGRVWNRDSSAAGDGMNLVFTAFGGLKAIQRINIIEESNGTETGAYITIPSGGGNGVTVTDTRIEIDVKNAAWTGLISGDSANVDNWKRFQLLSDRNTTHTAPDASGIVIIGRPPVIENYALNGSFGEPRNYERDSERITITGSSLQLVERVEIVDNAGGAIVNGAGSIVQRTPVLWPPNTPVYYVSPDQVDVNSSIWAGFPPDFGFADTIRGPNAINTSLGKMDGRRFRVINCFSTAVPVFSSVEDTFTQSARPDLTHDLGEQFNVEVYHGSLPNGVGNEEEHWIDIDGRDGAATGFVTLPVSITVNPVGIPPTQSGTLMGVKSVFFESNRTGVWTVQDVIRDNAPTGSFLYDTAQFDFDGNGVSANGGIQISADGRTMTMSAAFIDLFNTKSSDVLLPFPAPAGGYWNENSQVNMGVVHRVRFETIAGKIANTEESNELPLDLGVFFTYDRAMEEGIGARIAKVHGPGYLAGDHWERNSTLWVDGPGLDNATMIRFIDADTNGTLNQVGVANPLAQNAVHFWLDIDAVGITRSIVPNGAGGNYHRLTIPGGLQELRDVGHVIDSASDRLGELRRVEVRFADGLATAKRSEKHQFTICSPIVWPGGGTADEIFEGLVNGDVTDRSDDGLYFSKYNSFGWRPGNHQLRVQALAAPNSMRGVARIDFLDAANNVMGPAIDFNSTLGGMGNNTLYGFIATDNTLINPATFDSGMDTPAERASFMIIPSHHIDGTVNPNGSPATPARANWFESGDENPFTRKLRFTMRSGSTIDTPLIRAGRAPTFLGINTAIGPLDDRPEPSVGATWSNGYLSFNRSWDPADVNKRTHLDINATDVNRTVFQNLWFALSDDEWPFGDAAGDVDPGAVEAEQDDFPPPNLVTYPPSGFITQANMIFEGWARAGVPIGSAPATDTGVMRFFDTLFENNATFGGADTPGDDNQTVWQNALFGLPPPSMRITRQVVLETVFGQCSSFREPAPTVAPYNRQVAPQELAISTRWNFSSSPPVSGTDLIGYNNGELNATFEVNSTAVAGNNGWNGNTSTVTVNANSHLVITAFQPAPVPVNNTLLLVEPVAGGVRALRFRADNNTSEVIIEHDDFNITPAGIVNRAFYVSADLKQIVVNGNYVAEMRRLEGVLGIGANPDTFSTVFTTALAPPAPPAVEGGGVYLTVIMHGEQGNVTAPFDTTTDRNVIGPFGAN